MSDNNINEEWFNQHQWQPDMPSPDEAWQNMLVKLDKEMPVNHASIKRGTLYHTLYLIVLLMLWMNIKHTKESFNTPQADIHITGKMAVNASTDKQNKASRLNNKSSAIAAIQIQGNTLKSSRMLQAPRTRQRLHKLQAVQTSTPKPNDTIFEKDLPIIPNTTDSSAYNELANVSKEKTATQKPKSNVTHSIDSIAENDKETKEKLLVQAGLQWNLPIPVAGTRNYFASPSGNDQAWRILLPGAWVSINADKNILMAEINPFAAASFNPKPYYSNTQVIDSIGTLKTSKSITKVFGVSGAISFQHNIASNWWAGGGLQANFWSKGLAVLVVNEHNGATNTSSSTNPYALSKDDWQYFSKMQLYPHLQLMYRTNSYQAGLRTGATFTSLAQDAGAKNLVFTELFFKLTLISNHKK